MRSIGSSSASSRSCSSGGETRPRGRKGEARRRGLWNLFLPGLRDDEPGTRLTNLEYAPLAEIMGRVPWSSEVFNCSAPDTGNMEVLAKYGTPEQQAAWLAPLLRGEIRSAFCMTEPDVASSDATNIETSIVRDGDDYVINGRKWWSSGACNSHCRIYIVMGKTDPDNPDTDGDGIGDDCDDDQLSSGCFLT